MTRLKILKFASARLRWRRLIHRLETLAECGIGAPFHRIFTSDDLLNSSPFNRDTCRRENASHYINMTSLSLEESLVLLSPSQPSNWIRIRHLSLSPFPSQKSFRERNHNFSLLLSLPRYAGPRRIRQASKQPILILSTIAPEVDSAVDTRARYSLDAPLKCSLREKDLNTKPKYHALSYLWGASDSATTEPLYVPTSSGSNEQLFLWRNCTTALRHLRLAEEPRTMWVDSICIDQTSTLEKNQQVL
jgi:hypothetical protein